MDDRKKSVIDKVFQLAQRDPEFDIELRKRIGMEGIGIHALDDVRINEIYEYCIKKVSIKQAEEFYKDFPISSIVPNLVDDFVRMESFKRQDNFGDFCLALYQQIECMTNSLCLNKHLNTIVDKLWGYPAYIKSSGGSISNRADSDYTIASLVFWDLDKIHVTLQNQYAKDKMKIVVYFVGYNCAMKSSDYDSFIEITNLLNDIYQCRNINHRGNKLTDKEEAILNRILPLRSFYYFKFHGVLAQYVEFIKNGFPFLEANAAYCDTIEKKTIKNASKGPKVLYKIDLPPDNRFK